MALKITFPHHAILRQGWPTTGIYVFEHNNKSIPRKYSSNALIPISLKKLES